MQVLWGLHAVSAALANPERQCRRLFVTEAGRSALEGLAGPIAAPAPELVERTQLDRLAGDEATHQGVLLWADPLPELGEDDLAGLIEAAGPRVRLVVLDQVTDPHNVGAVLRSAAAFGAAAVIVQTRYAPAVTGVLAKAASGALEHVPILRAVNLARLVEQVKGRGITVLALDEEGGEALGTVPLAGPAALLLGAEGAGLRRLLKDRADRVLRLPTRGPIDSLNVSNAAAIALYELARQD